MADHAQGTRKKKNVDLPFQQLLKKFIHVLLQEKKNHWKHFELTVPLFYTLKTYFWSTVWLFTIVNFKS